MGSSVLIGLTVMLLLGSCGTAQEQASEPLDRSAALELAVKLANDECMRRFLQAPFHGPEYPIRLEDNRWTWGTLDVAAPGGLSAIVSFTLVGDDRTVEVFLSTDKVPFIEPNREDD